MAFGQELKDFVSGFQTGSQIKGQKEDRKYRRERDEADRAYREGRAERSDMESDRNHEFRTDQFEWGKTRAGVQDRQWFEMMGLKQRELGLAEDQLKLDHAAGVGSSVPNMVDDHLQNPIPVPGEPETRSPPAGDQDSSRGVIPEGATMQLASYSPSGANAQGASDTAMALFSPDTYFSSIRTAESGGNDRAKNPNSSATGRYQFISGTWNGLAKKYPELGLTPDGRFDPAQQERAIKAFTKDNARSLQSAGIPITNGTLYAAHFLGDGGARKVLGSGAPNAKVSQLVTPDVIRANPFLRDMSVKDFFLWAEKKGGGSLGRQQQQGIRAAKGGLVQNFAAGGLVGALAVDDEEEDDTPGMALPEENVQVADASGAIPVPEPRPERPSPSYEGTSESDLPPISDSAYQNGWNAVRIGMEQAVKRSGIDRSGAISDPDLERARQNYLKGYGAATPQMMKQVLDTVDPERKMSVSERNMYALGSVYQFFVERGEFDKAKETAASMYQAYRMASNQFLALGQAAAAEGDIDNTVKSMVLAYANIPNGRDLRVVKVEGGYEVKVVDEETGEEVAKKVMEPKDFAAAVMQFNPGTFDDEILAAAGAKVEVERSSESNLRERGGSIDDLLADTETMGEDFNPDWTTPIAGVAKSIASHTDNNFDDRTAVQIATELWRAWEDTGEGARPLFQQRAVPGTGGKTVEVTLNDDITFQVDKSFLTRMKKSVETEMGKNRKVDTGAGEEFKKGADAAVEHFTAPPPNEPNPDIIKEGERPITDRLNEPRVAPGTTPKFWADEPVIPENETELEGLLRRREEIRQRNDPRLRGVLDQIEKRIKQLEGK